MHTKTLAELARDLKARKFSSEELTRAFLARIERYNPQAQRLHHRACGNRRRGSARCR